MRKIWNYSGIAVFMRESWQMTAYTLPRIVRYRSEVLEKKVFFFKEGARD